MAYSLREIGYVLLPFSSNSLPGDLDARLQETHDFAPVNPELPPKIAKDVTFLRDLIDRSVLRATASFNEEQARRKDEAQNNRRALALGIFSVGSPFNSPDFILRRLNIENNFPTVTSELKAIHGWAEAHVQWNKIRIEASDRTTSVATLRRDLDDLRNKVRHAAAGEQAVTDQTLSAYKKQRKEMAPYLRQESVTNQTFQQIPLKAAELLMVLGIIQNSIAAGALDSEDRSLFELGDRLHMAVENKMPYLAKYADPNAELVGKTLANLLPIGTLGRVSTAAGYIVSGLSAAVDHGMSAYDDTLFYESTRQQDENRSMCHALVGTSDAVIGTYLWNGGAAPSAGAFNAAMRVLKALGIESSQEVLLQVAENWCDRKTVDDQTSLMANLGDALIRAGKTVGLFVGAQEIFIAVRSQLLESARKSLQTNKAKRVRTSRAETPPMAQSSQPTVRREVPETPRMVGFDFDAVDEWIPLTKDAERKAHQWLCDNFHLDDAHANEILEGLQIPGRSRAQVIDELELHGIEATKAKEFVRSNQEKAAPTRTSDAKVPTNNANGKSDEAPKPSASAQTPANLNGGSIAGFNTNRDPVLQAFIRDGAKPNLAPWSGCAARVREKVALLEKFASPRDLTAAGVRVRRYVSIENTTNLWLRNQGRYLYEGNYLSLRVNDQYRLVFRYDETARQYYDLHVVNYHN